MFMLWLYRYMTGYVIFEAKGQFPERFLNLCSKDGTAVWDAVMQNGVLAGCMSVHNYKHVRKKARKAKVRLRVVKRRGLNFIVHRYRRRPGLAVGFVSFFLLIQLMSSFVWDIQIVGAQRVPENEILQVLEQAGVKKGTLRRAIDTEQTRQYMLINTEGLSWAAVNIEGCFATIDVRETRQEEEKEDKNSAPCNIVATRGGEIVSVKAYNGIPAVKTGEAVAAGDLLVSGTATLKNGTTKFVHADAQVIAKTEHELSVFVPYVQEKTVKSEESVCRRVFSFFNLDIPLFTGSVDKPYQREKAVWQPQIGGVKLPLSITTARFYPTRTEEYTIDKEQAKKLCVEKMQALCEKEIGDIVEKQIDAEFTYQKDGILYTCRYLCEEDIGKTENIIINQ